MISRVSRRLWTSGQNSNQLFPEVTATCLSITICVQTTRRMKCSLFFMVIIVFMMASPYCNACIQSVTNQRQPHIPFSLQDRPLSWNGYTFTQASHLNFPRGYSITWAKRKTKIASRSIQSICLAKYRLATHWPWIPTKLKLSQRNTAEHSMNFWCPLDP